MMQILDNEKEQKIMPLFRLAFRPFFLAASAFSVIAMLVWALFWSGLLTNNQLMYGNPLWWHSHEMLIGFTGAVIIGFLLTAVQNWTGNPGVRGGKLAAIFVLWLAARVGLLLGQPHIIWMIIDLSWIPLAAYFLAKPIIIRRQWNNLFFTPLLILLTLINAAMHLNALSLAQFDQHQLTLALVTVVSVIVLVVGGRVIPFFTWRGTDTAQITRLDKIEWLALIPSWLLLLNVLLPVPEAINRFSLPALFLVTGLTNLVRFARWRSFSTCKVPLLWSLHFAYAAMIVGMLLLGVHFAGGSVGYSTALHFITVGGMGGMILAMMARVSLGHTGRNLKVGRIVVIAFVLMVACVLTRTLLIMLFPAMVINGYVLSAVLWTLAFGIFTIVYFPILTKPRLDGRPG
ncbi:NnrS family protein [Photobacterium sanguinicancri]|uniref:NnrS family protein n=1 Tax=Photobacterium sanguinicancri TaxID=875932 RepID=A0AAW7YAD7_9GAMM|nr:NnrS family protein [Photobacterium sanguinicancri]MDO6545191.1 NnrS family protein [Photobacterium sanguinicancri]